MSTPKKVFLILGDLLCCLRIDVGPPGRPCWQCVLSQDTLVDSALDVFDSFLGSLLIEVRPHVDMTLRSSRTCPRCEESLLAVHSDRDLDSQVQMRHAFA